VRSDRERVSERDGTTGRGWRRGGGERKTPCPSTRRRRRRRRTGTRCVQQPDGVCARSILLYNCG